MNNDMSTEILLHLPVQSLLRFRAVCKFWAGLIDSSPFRKLHTQNNNKSDDTVYLEVILSNGGTRVQHNMKSLISYSSDHLKGFGLGLGLTLPDSDDDRVRLYGPVKGLISIDCAKRGWPLLNPFPNQLRVPIAICNPFLGQLKLLPLLPTSSSNLSCRVSRRSVAIGYDEYFKVVQLSWCDMHFRLHAHVYSRKTDSWRELDVEDELGFLTIDPIKSACENGHFAHWHMYSFPDEMSKILFFDMKNEVFNTIELDIGFSDTVDTSDHVFSTIFAEDEHSFRRFRFNDELVHIYETRCEGSKLGWNYVTNVKIPRIEIIPLWMTGFVVIEDWTGATFVYDYRERKFICKLPKAGFLLIEYRGSFVSLIEKVN